MITKRKNFIINIIKNDILNNKYNYIKTRFSPEPNGCLHIGHVKSICLNFDIAKIYNGKCNLRFDDTNPENELEKYVYLIKKDIEWLGFSWSGEIKYTSEYFENIYKYAIKLIKKKLAYVDKLPSDQIKENRGNFFVKGKNSPYREQSVEENLSLFHKMREGFFKEEEACLRAKINMKSSNLLMRDPVIYRIKFKKHYRTGKKWLIYPTYDFSHCISDSIEKISHSLCTTEFEGNRKLYNWILKNLDIEHKPSQYEISRLNIKNVITSKRKINEMISNSVVEGWNDPRLFTISGLKRRGYTAQSILEFCRNVGISKKYSLIDKKYFYSCTRNSLDKTSKRFMAVINPVLLIIKNIPENYKKKIYILKNPKDPNLGKRCLKIRNKIYIEKSDIKKLKKNYSINSLIGKKIKLKYSFFIKIKKVKINNKGNILKILCNYYYNEIRNIKKEKIKIIHWVSLKDSIKANFLFYRNLKKITTNLPIKEKIIKKTGFVEKSILKEKKETFQFERIGYFCIEKKTMRTLAFNNTTNLKK